MNEREAIDAIRALCERPNAVTRGVPTWDIEAVLDRVESPPPPAIDRDALLGVISDVFDYAGYEAGGDTLDEFADRILALVRPAAGVTLTPQEAALAAYALDYTSRSGVGTPTDRELRKRLAARLEAGDA